METSHTTLFSESQNRIASLAKALGHPARIAILEHLFEKEVCICGELVEEIGLAQATVSQHLKKLKNAGIIQGTVEGVKVCYCINSEKWEEIGDLLGVLLAKKSNLKNSCC